MSEVAFLSVFIGRFINLQSHDSKSGDELCLDSLLMTCADGLEVCACLTSNIHLHLHLDVQTAYTNIICLLLSGLGPLMMLPPATCCCSFIPDPPPQP
jgi:hypothetical protein